MESLQLPRCCAEPECRAAIREIDINIYCCSRTITICQIMLLYHTNGKKAPLSHCLSGEGKIMNNNSSSSFVLQIKFIKQVGPTSLHRINSLQSPHHISLFPLDLQPPDLVREILSLISLNPAYIR